VILGVLVFLEGGGVFAGDGDLSLEDFEDGSGSKIDGDFDLL
jgi:hypothetical protein